jgi:hypothetical protein
MRIDARSIRGVAAVMVLLGTARETAAQQPTWHGQIRPRFEHRDTRGGPADAFVSMRTRLGVDIALEEVLHTARAGLQDVAAKVSFRPRDGFP